MKKIGKLKSIIFFIGLFLWSNFAKSVGNADVTIGTTTSNGTWTLVSGTHTFTPSANSANVSVSDITTKLTTGHVRIITACSGSGSQTGVVTLSSAISSTSGRNFTIESSGNININQSITIDGPAASSTGSGNKGGNITLTSTSGTVSLSNNINTRGSAGGSAGYGSGGAGGNVTISGTSVSFTSGSIIATGGAGRGTGGAGGVVSITSTSSTINITRPITTTGGTGGACCNSSNGGRGGNVTINAYTTLTVSGTISANGGNRVDYYSCGGSGATVTLTGSSITKGTINVTKGTSGGGVSSTCNSNGTTTENIVNRASPPTVTTTSVSSITCTSSSSGGNVTSDGGAAITGRGIVVGTSANPSIGGTGVTQITSTGTTGSFTSTLSSLTPGTTYNIRAYAINNAGTSYGTNVSFTTSSSPSAGTLSGTQSVCVGGTTTFTSTISGGSWSSSNTSVATVNSSSGVVSGVSSGTATMTYTITGSTGCSNATATRTVTVNALPNTVTVTGGGTICSGSSLTLSASNSSSGTIYWQNTTNNGTSTTTAATSMSVNSSGTYYFRAQSTQGCWGNQGSATVTVSPTTVAGSISGSTTVCSGSNSGSLTLSGHTGNVIRWESSTNGTTWNSITNTTTSQSYSNLTTTTQYRAVVQSGSCSSATTSAVSITVSPTTVAGSISGSTTVCSGSNSGSLTLSGHTGNVIRWESSTNGTTWNSITNTTTTQSYTNLTTTTQYRAVVQSGVCSSATTSAVSITVSPTTVAGSISGSTTVCSGSNSGSLTLSGHTGNVIRWESSTDGTTWNSITNTTTTQSYTNLTTTTQYRAVVQSGVCSELNTLSATVTVYSDLTAGSISGNQTMCSGVSPDSIINITLPTGGNGIYSYQWQSSTDNSSWSNISGQTLKDYFSGIVGTNTYYRRSVNSGTCPTKYTSSSLIKVNNCSGPGGVVSDVTLWLKADEGTIGDPITTWEDQSGNEKHAIRSLGNPVKESVSLNYNPTVNFDGNSGFDTDSVLIEQMFIVLKPSLTSTSNNFQILGRKNHSSNTKARVFGFGNRTVISSNDSSSFSSVDRIRVNGKSNVSLSNTNIISVDAENKGGVRDVYKLGQKSSGTSYDNLNGEIAEIICYSSKKSGMELNKIESYLAIKYGVTLSNVNGGSNGNYYSSNGDTIWKSSSYHNDVIGIGKDNSQKLNQKQSRTNDGKLSIFIDNLSSTNNGNLGTISNDRSYIMVGHNNASLKSDSIIDLESPSEIKHRLSREWKITNTNFDDNFNLEIEWDSTGTFDLSDVRLLVDDDGDFTNADVYGPADGLTFRLGSIIVEDINSSFIPKGSTKYITIGSVDSLTVLPVDLLYFKGEQNGTNVDLKWETGSEINSDYFEVLHSTNGFDFKKIGRLNAAGNSTSCKKYELTHYNAEQGINYYKLKQYDFGGRYEEYETIMVLFDYITEDYEFLVYPNPNNDNGVVYLKTDYTGEVIIHIFDMKGRVVRKELINIKQNNVETIKDLNLPTGIYPFVISSPNNSFLSKTFKLIIN